MFIIFDFGSMSYSSLCGKFTLIIQINKSLDKESGMAGESYLPADKFSNFALHLATMYKGENQSVIQGTFNKMFDLIQGIQEADLFNENPDTTPRTLVEAIKEVLNIEYNGQLRSNVLAGDNSASQGGQQGSNGNAPSGEQNQDGQGTDDGGRRTGISDIEPGGQRDATDTTGRQHIDSSQKELDENGHPFVVASNGTTTFGVITEETGLPTAPIKLSEGFQDEDGKGYGLLHIEANHGQQIRNAGFSSVEEFVSFVATNYDENNIRVGKRRDKSGSITYLIQVTDEHDNTLFIELSRDGSYWNVNSGGVFRKGYSNKKRTVVKTEPQQPNNAVSTDSSLSESGDNGITPTEPNGESTVPFDDSKVTDNSSAKQKNAGENVSEPTHETETLENGDVRITNRNSRGEVTNVSVERDGKIVSVGSYQDGALFERTEYDADGNATKVTRYGKNGEVVGVQEYEGGVAKAGKRSNSVATEETEGEVQEQGTADLQQGELDLDVDNPAFERATERTIDALKAAGVEVVEATDAMVEEVLGMAEMHKQKKAPETASVQEEHQPTVVSSADGAKLLKDLDSVITEYENKSGQSKTFLGDIAQVLGATKHGSNSQYATFEAVNGKVFTIRLANHNAKVSNFDNHGENEGISIVVTAQDNNGINNDGNAHVVEFFYDAIKLRKADGKPLVEILKSIKQALYSGEYKDTTGLAQTEEVNIPEFMQVYHGSGAKFDKFDHSFMGTGEGAQTFGWGTYVTEVEGIGKSYAEASGRTPLYKGMEQRTVWVSNLENEAAVHHVMSEMMQGRSFEIAINRVAERAREIGDTKLENDVNELSPQDFTYKSRQLYTVEIPDDTGKNYLYWYNGITDEQKKMIADAAQKEGIEFDFYGDKMNANEYFAEMGKGIEGHQLYGMLKRVLGSDKAASEFLNRIGYVGIKYPTESLSGGNKDGKSNYVIFNEADAQITDRVEFLRTADGVVYGWAVDGKIYLTKEGMNPNTPAHEYTHLWAHMIEKTDPTLWSRIVDGLRGCATWNEVLNDKAYESIWNDDSRMASEVLSRLTGSENYRREMARAQQEIADAKGALEKAEKISAWEKVKMALRDFLGRVKSLIQKGERRNEKGETIRDVETDVPAWMEFVDMALGDLYGGVNPVEVVNRRGRDAQSVETIVREFGLNPPALSEIINSRSALEWYSSRIDEDIYEGVLESYDKGCGGVSVTADGYSLVFIFKEHCKGGLDEQMTWWHEQAHCAYIKAKFEKMRLAYDALDWLEDNAPLRYNNILNSYDRADWEDEAVAVFIEELVTRYGTSKFLEADFAELGELATLADVIRNSIKNGTEDTNKKIKAGYRFGKPASKSLPRPVGRQEDRPHHREGSIEERHRITQEFRGDASQGTGRPEADELNGYATYINKEKALNYLHLATPIVAASNNQELVSATKVVESFENPQILGQENDGDTLFSYKPFGGNSGYVGYSMSKRAAQAREEGRFPKTDFKKEYGVTEKVLDALVKAGIVDNAEWHHTSMYGNKTPFYGWVDDAYADVYAENKKTVKQILEGKNADGTPFAELPTENPYTEMRTPLPEGWYPFLNNLDDNLTEAERESALMERFGDAYAKLKEASENNRLYYEYEANKGRMEREYYAKVGEKLKEFFEDKVATASQLTGTDGAATMPQRSGQGDVVNREGEGSFSDDALSGMSDPMAKMLGASTYSARQRREFAERARKRMVRRAESIAKELHLDNVEVVTDVSVLPEGKKRGAKGFYSKSTGKITIVVPNHAGTYDIQQTVLHEAVAHYGLRQLFGTHFDTFLDNVFENVSSEIRNRIIGLARQNGWDFRTATEEYLAMLAEDVEFSTAQKSSWWSKIKGFFLKMLADAGVKLDFTLSDNELRYILWRSYQNLANPGKYASVVEQAADIAKQYDLKVGNYRNSATDLDAVAEQVREREDVLFREDTPRERAIIRDRYERRVKTGWGCCVQSLNNSF